MGRLTSNQKSVEAFAFQAIALIRWYQNQNAVATSLAWPARHKRSQSFKFFSVQLQVGLTFISFTLLTAAIIT